MKVIIVEDEFLAQQELSWLIKEHSQMEIVGTFDDGLDVLKFLQHNRVDAIFLDINIPSLDGVLLAQNISQFAHKPFIVFITAWKEHAVEAFELEAFDYILKPYQESRITGMLDRMRQLLEWANDHYDLVIVDTPPMLAVSDAAVVGRSVGTSLLVARFGLNTAKEVSLSMQRLEQAGVNIKGAILNGVIKRASTAYSYGYNYYGYSYSEKE